MADEELGGPALDTAPDAAIEASVAPEPTAPETDTSPEEEQGLSVEEAFERALARAKDSEDEEETAEGDGEPASAVEPNAAGEAPEDAAKPADSQAVLDRVYQLWKQGREEELSPQERGILRRMELDATTRIQTQQAQEESFRDLYLGLLAQKDEDPEAFAHFLQSDPKGEESLRFMKAYAAAHPDVTLDSPQAPVVKRADVYRDAVAQAFDTVDTALATVAGKYGLTDADLESAYEKSGNDFASYLDAIVAAAAKAEVERERPKIAKAEREAHAAELQVVRAKKTIITPRPLNGAPASKPVAPVDHGDFDSVFARAAAEAKRAIEA